MKTSSKKMDRLNRLIEELDLPLTECTFENKGGMYLKFNLEPRLHTGILLSEMDRCNDEDLKKIIWLRFLDFGHSILDAVPDTMEELDNGD